MKKSELDNFVLNYSKIHEGSIKNSGESVDIFVNFKVLNVAKYYKDSAQEKLKMLGYGSVISE